MSLPVAIVGIAAQLPSGQSAQHNLDHTQFFNFLLNKGQSYQKIPLDRFNIDSYHGSNPGQVNTKLGTFLKHTDMIDHTELGITNKDARSMSLSTRKLIELAFLALQDSGIHYRAQNIGCFASGIIFDVLSLSDPDEFEARGSFGGPPAMIANRISYHLDLTGPSVPVDTACSSSLTATHLAVQSIRAGDCNAAVVAGIQLNNRFVDWVQYSQGGILAPDGKCKPFDAAANGFSRGEAGVSIVLKRLDHALADNDHIYATILGTGINSAGSAAPVNAPVAAAQHDAMRRAWAQTGRNPHEVDYVELHATGTAAGDPAEANWVGDAFRRAHGDEDDLLIGSVKGNIGHTEIAAFLASLAKVLGIFRTGLVPPNANYSPDTRNPAIRWDTLRLRVPTEPEPFRARSGLVALCSSGIGGANGHAVLQAPPPRAAALLADAPHDPAAPRLFVAGGMSPRSAAAVADTLAALAARAPPAQLAALATLYARRARGTAWRAAAVYTPTSQTTPLAFPAPALAPRTHAPLVLVFAGQGPQHPAMGRALYRAFPVFRASIDATDAAYHAATGASLLGAAGLFAGDEAKDLGAVWPIALTLPALAMLQCALVDLLHSVGVRADAVVGHSAGETAVLYASGAGTRAMAVELAAARGEAMALLEHAGGGMAALACGAAHAQALIGTEEDVDIACYNAPDAVTLAGPADALARVVARAKAGGVQAAVLRTRVPVHSRMMERVRTEYTAAVAAVFARHPGAHVPAVPVFSAATGQRMLPGEAFTADYFWAGTRGAVRFAEAGAALFAAFPGATCLEAAPHPVLGGYLAALGAGPTLPLLRRGHDEHATLLGALGRLTVLGHSTLDFCRLNGAPHDPTLDLGVPGGLPPYPFAPKAVPWHSDAPAWARQFRGRKGPLNFAGLRVGAGTHPVLEQHVIKGEPIMPAAGFIEMALEFGAVELWDVEFRAMLSLSAEKPVPVEVALDGVQWTVKTASRRDNNNNGAAGAAPVFDKVHAEGCLSRDTPQGAFPPLDVHAVQARCRRMDVTDLYEELKTFAEYGPAFQRVVDAFSGDNEVLVLVRGPDDDIDTEGFCFHPAVLDCCLHIMVHKSFTLSTDPNAYYLPARVGRLVAHPALVDSEFPDHVYAHVVFRRWTPGSIVADFTIVAIDGTRLCTLTDVEVARHESVPGGAVAARFDVALQPLAVPVQEEREEDTVVAAGSAVDMNDLHTYLDYLAARVIRATVEGGAVPGAQLDRQRYAAFARAVAAGPLGAVPPCDAATARELERRWPEMVEVTNRLASVHGKIFETSKAAVEVLYKDDVMTRFYRHYDWASEACAARFRAVLEDMVRAGKRVVRVLEVGSGTGALTRHLADVMADFPAAVVEFVVSDVSKELLPRMAYPRCRYKALDISRDPEAQGFAPASFDVVTGFDVLHVVPDMAPSLAALNRLLVPGGRLLIGDLNGGGFAARAPGAVWFDFVFGSFAEWFAFTDGRTHCAMSAAEWRARLGAAGFARVATAAFAADPLLFTLEAQKVREAALAPSAAPARAQDKTVFAYRRGREGALRARLAACDAAAPLSVWLTAAAGFDGDAGTGLARSLGREYALWDVHCVVFEGAGWSEVRQREFVVGGELGTSAEALLHVDASGAISVPRVVPAPAPSGHRAFQPALPWAVAESGEEVVQVSVPCGKDDVTVRVLAMSPAEHNYRGFVGRMAEEGELVVGVAHSPKLCNVIAVHRSSVAVLPAEAEAMATDIAGSALGVAIGSAATSLSALLSTRRRRRQGVAKALLSHLGPVVSPSLKWFLQLLGVEVVQTKVDTPAAIAALGSKFDIIVSGSGERADYQGYKRVLARNGGRLFVWNDARSGLPALLKDDPLAAGEALDAAVERIAGHWRSESSGIALSEVSLPRAGTLVPSSASVFDSSKAYVLVGGIGGLGIRIALWMYERGARYLVLTSRSGRDTLARVQDRLALRIVDYLESLPDLTVRLEASDATSDASTASLLRSIPVPLGGCMLLSVVLSDRTFAFQEEDDFDKVFASKTGACRVLEKCIPNGIGSLDFFVAFSSVVGLFGNGGQTNYSGANTALDGIVRNWDNAFTFVLPAVSDGGGLASETREQGGRLGHLTPWGMSAERLCDCLEDGIRKLADGPFWQYVPDLDWTLVQKFMGPAPLFSHLVDSTTEEGTSQVAESGTSSLQDIVLELLDVDASEFSPDVPFTAYGLDSLSASRLSFALRPYVSISQLQLLSDVTLNDLSERAEKSKDDDQSSISSQSSDGQPDKNPRVAQIEDMISKYSRSFKKHTGNQKSSTPEGEVVLVTGTTGAIGSAVLAQLAAMPSVRRIYAFNRASTRTSTTLRERQASSLESRGYQSSILTGGKIVLVEGDQTALDLGIPSTLYEEIRDSVTSIMHNAWPVNFTTSLESLEPAVRSVRAMVDLALGSSLQHPPRLLFVSSIGLFYNRKGNDAAPEQPITDINLVAGTGYSESKYVGERILEKAAEETTLRPIVVRAGQICGGLNGAWSTSEWFPSLVKSSIYLGCLPDMEGNISWLPLQAAAEALIDMRDAHHQTLHISHPQPISGSLISGTLAKALKLPLVPYAEWLAQLQKSAGEGRSGGDANPALGLLDYFLALEVSSNASKEALGLPKLSVVEAVKSSPALRKAGALTTRDVERWLENWNNGGFLTV